MTVRSCRECGRPLFDGPSRYCDACVERHRVDEADYQRRHEPDIGDDHDDPVSRIRRDRPRGYA